MIRQIQDLVIRNVSYGFDRRLAVHPASSCRVDPGGGEIVSFSNCSYLGLDAHPAVIEGGVELARRYGATYTCSRLFCEFAPLLEAEALLSRIFKGGHALLGTSTTLHHVGLIPALTCSDDLLCYDRAVHTSVQEGIRHAETWGVPSRRLGHNDLTGLKRILERPNPYRRVWYLCDGVYSMDSDLMPLSALRDLQARFPQLWLYVDDSHGVGWCGAHGEGLFLGAFDTFPARCVVVNALSKSFGSGGSVALLPDDEMGRRLRMTANHLIFSTPPQVAVIGQILAAARLHLGDELPALQQRLRENIRHTYAVAERLGLRLLDQSETPIISILVGEERLTMDCALDAAREGLLLNPAVFPAVAKGRAIIRLTMNAGHRAEDIERALEYIARALHERAPAPAAPVAAPAGVRPTSFFQRGEHGVSVCDGAAQVDTSLWEGTLGRATLLGHALTRTLEEVYTRDVEPEAAWIPSVLLVNDRAGEILAATYTIETRVKDDMLSPPAVSEVVERARLERPDFLVSRAMMTGTLLTEGRHLYLRDDSEESLRALDTLVEVLVERFKASRSNSLFLRDFFVGQDERVQARLRDQGFMGVLGPRSATFTVRWDHFDGYLDALTGPARHAVRKALRATADVETRLEHRDLSGFYPLYQELTRSSHELNLFPYPPALFERLMTERPGDYQHLEWWRDGELLASGGLYHHGHTLFPMVAGFRPGVKQLYRRMLLDLVDHAIRGGFREIRLGFGGIDVKASVGCDCPRTRLWVQVKDTRAVTQLAMIQRGLDIPTPRDEPPQHHVWKAP